MLHASVSIVRFNTHMDNIITEKFATITNIEVIITCASIWSSPYQNSHSFEGDTKFTSAMAFVCTKQDSDDIVHIYVTETHGNWKHRHEVCKVEFVKFFAFEVLKNTLSKFTSVAFKHAKGYGKDASEVIKAEEAKAYNAHEDGERHWKNLVAQESAIANAKAEAERIANDILNAKSTGKSEASDERFD